MWNTTLCIIVTIVIFYKLTYGNLDELWIWKGILLMSHYLHITTIYRLLHSSNSLDHCSLMYGGNWRLVELMWRTVSFWKRHCRQSDIMQTLKVISGIDKKFRKLIRTLATELQVDDATIPCGVHENLLSKSYVIRRGQFCSWEPAITYCLESSASEINWNIQRSQECCNIPPMRNILFMFRKGTAKKSVSNYHSDDFPTII